MRADAPGRRADGGASGVAARQDWTPRAPRTQTGPAGVGAADMDRRRAMPPCRATPSWAAGARSARRPRRRRGRPPPARLHRVIAPAEVNPGATALCRADVPHLVERGTDAPRFRAAARGPQALSGVAPRGSLPGRSTWRGTPRRRNRPWRPPAVTRRRRRREPVARLDPPNTTTWPPARATASPRRPARRASLLTQDSPRRRARASERLVGRWGGLPDASRAAIRNVAAEVRVCWPGCRPRGRGGTIRLTAHTRQRSAARDGRRVGVDDKGSFVAVPASTGLRAAVLPPQPRWQNRSGCDASARFDWASVSPSARARVWTEDAAAAERHARRVRASPSGHGRLQAAARERS